MIFNLVDTIAIKETPPRAAKIFLMLMETCVDKLDSIIDVLDEVNVRLERSKKQEPETGKVFMVEKARPVAVSVYAIEKPEDVVAGEYCPLKHSSMHIIHALLQNRDYCSALSFMDSALALRAFARWRLLFRMGP